MEEVCEKVCSILGHVAYLFGLFVEYFVEFMISGLEDGTA